MKMDEVYVLAMLIRENAPWLDGLYVMPATPYADSVPEPAGYMVVIQGDVFGAELYGIGQWVRLVEYLEASGGTTANPKVIKREALEAWAWHQMKRADLPEWERPSPRGKDDFQFCEKPGRN